MCIGPILTETLPCTSSMQRPLTTMSELYVLFLCLQSIIRGDPAHAMQAQDELLRTVEELCDDLASKTISRADAASILQALVALATASRPARHRLMIVLMRREVNSRLDIQSGAMAAVPRLCQLLNQFLYDNHTCLGMLELLAVLAHENPANQTRIVSIVPGVALTTDDPSMTLYVVCLPRELRQVYKRWDRRFAELTACRVPFGSPPTRAGVPAPCFCDECLGAPQLLAAWANHFQDLTRWQSMSMTDTSDQVHKQLRGDFFVRGALDASYTMHSHAMTQSVAELKSTGAQVYYFSQRPSGESGRQAASAPPIDPRQHVCAIRIQVSVPDREPGPLARNHPEVRVHDAGDGHADLESVLLLGCEAVLLHCEKPRHLLFPEAARLISSYRASGDPLTPRLLLDATGSEMSPTEKHLLDRILCCLEPDTVLDPEQLHALLGLTTTTSVPRTTSASVWITAHADSVEMVARTHEGTHTSALSLTQIGIHSALHLADETVAELVRHARLCPHSDTRYCEDSRQGIHLQRVSLQTQSETSDILSHGTSTSTPTTTGNRSVGGDRHGRAKPRDQDRTNGLSCGAERIVRTLLGRLGSVTEMPTVVQQLERIVHDCNARLTRLAEDSGLSDGDKIATRERTRTCRDATIKTLKRLKLRRPSSNVESIDSSQKHIIDRYLRHVLAASTARDVWEAQDTRSTSDKPAFSGPDPEFFIMNATRSKANRKLQHHLNQLLAQQHQKRIPVEEAC